MKKLGIFFSIMALIVACHDDNDDFVKNVEHSVSVTYGDAYDNLKAKEADIVITNKQTAVEYKGKTDESGIAIFSIPVGTYKIAVSKKLTAEKSLALLGIKQEANFNASNEEVVVNEENTATELKMVAGRIGNLLIKQIYYCGSSKLGAKGRDQFVEIHNNSNETLYLDGLCFAQLYGVQKTGIDQEYLLSSGQYDWSKSPDLEGLGSKANTDYVYAHMVVAFPGTGKEHPIESGKSVIVASIAQNHKAPLTIGKKTFTVENPNLTIDLSKAPFETYFPEFEKYNMDIDNPSSVNLVLKKDNGMPEMYLNYQGNEAYAIFYATDEDLNTWKKVQRPEPERRKKLHLQIPINVIIDGVNIQNNAKPLATHLQESIDAGSSISVRGAFSSESTIRKVSKKIGEKTFYQDTNNSTNDFEQIERPDISSLN